MSSAICAFAQTLVFANMSLDSNTSNGRPAPPKIVCGFGAAAKAHIRQREHHIRSTCGIPTSFMVTRGGCANVENISPVAPSNHRNHFVLCCLKCATDGLYVFVWPKIGTPPCIAQLCRCASKHGCQRLLGISYGLFLTLLDRLLFYRSLPVERVPNKRWTALPFRAAMTQSKKLPQVEAGEIDEWGRLQTPCKIHIQAGGAGIS